MSTKDLDKDLNELQRIFSEYGEKHWGRKISGTRHPKALISMFGGMGSINDVYLCKGNGHSIPEEIEQEVNSKIERLLSRIYENCTQLLRDEER